MVDYGKALGRGLRFGIRPKRWLQLFILDLIFISIGLAIILPNIPEFMSLISQSSQDMTAALSIVGAAASVFVVFIVWILVRIWFMGSIVHQSYKEKDKISNGFRIAGRKYLHILVAMIIVGIIAGIVSLVPYYVGAVLAFVVSWIFFFFIQGIVVSNMGCIRTLENSWKIFRKNPLQVFLAWLLIAIMVIVINIIFSVPAMVLFFGIIFSLGPVFMGGQALPSEVIASLSQVIQANLPALIVVVIIALVGVSISQTFSLKAQTEFYLQLKKK